MFGDAYNNEGENDDFRPASPITRQPQLHGKSAHAPRQAGSRAPPAAAVTLASAIGGGGRVGGNVVGAANAFGAAPNALREDSDDDGAARVKSVAEIVQQLDEEQELQSRKGGCCSRLFIPAIVVVLLCVIIFATVWTSGNGSDVAAAPRVAVIIVEGLTGTAFDEMVRGEQHLPNIATLLNTRGGVYAACPSATSSTCARAVAVEDTATGSVHVYSGSGIASILTGVSPARHGVRNDTLDAYAEYASTSNTYPSIAKRVTDAGKRVSVVGTSHLLNSFGPTTGRCTEPGVLDMECAATKNVVIADVADPLNPGYTALECLSSATCNTYTRKMKSPTNPDEYSDGHSEVQFSRQLKEVFGELELTKPKQESATQNTVADNLDDSLFIFHFDALALRTGSATLPDFAYGAANPSYVGQAYLIDAMIGQVLSFINDRAKTQKENWLVLGLADHGGSKKSFTNPTGSGNTLSASQVIAFFMSTFTTNAKEFVKLKPLGSATSQLDVLPTVLRWLNIVPFDEATQLAAEGKNTSYSEEVEGQLAARRVFEGQVRGVCSSGVLPTDCV